MRPRAVAGGLSHVGLTPAGGAGAGGGGGCGGGRGGLGGVVMGDAKGMERGGGYLGRWRLAGSGFEA